MMPKHKKSIWWAVAITGMLCGMTSGAFLALTRDLPQIQSLENFEPSSVTRVLSSDNVLLAELFIEKREPVSLAQIPEPIITALIATEDRRFYRHSGVDIKGLLRAVLKNIKKGRYAEGASTLTQQLTKTLFLTPRKTMIRKLREAVLAIQLERRYTKDEILTLYLNQIYLGSGAYGISAAARIYFGKSLKDLTLAQCALIAGLPKAPSRFSPLVNPDLALKRRNIVLNQMFLTGAIDNATYHLARQEAIIPSRQDHTHNKAPAFIQYLKEALEEEMGADRLYKSGLTVHTTLSYKLQQAAHAAVSSGLEQMEVRMSSNQMIAAQPQAALIAIDIITGGIKSMVGGRDATGNDFNRATMAKRQPGSAFKPIVYALALERGFDQTHTLLDAPVVFQSNPNGQDWQPKNFTKTYDGEITMRWALAQSKNIPVIRLMEKIGPSAVIDFSHGLGLRSELHANLSLALGTSEVTLMELTAAYAAFGNLGKHIQPYGVAQVIDKRGNIIWQVKPEQRIAMSRSSAAIITDMLVDVIETGTGHRANTLPGPLAGKTGTTNKTKDALFVGYSPQLAAGVWVGNDDATTLGPGETGAQAALPIWIAFMRQAVSDGKQHYFDIPNDVRYAHIHPRTGESLAEENSKSVRVLVKKNNPQ